MAHILPQTPPQSLPPETLSVFRALKSLPDTYFIWHHLAPWQENTPDFLMVTRDARALLVKVSTAKRDQMSVAAQLRLIDDQRPPAGLAEEAVLINYIRSAPLPQEDRKSVV